MAGARDAPAPTQLLAGLPHPQLPPHPGGAPAPVRLQRQAGGALQLLHRLLTHKCLIVRVKAKEEIRFCSSSL